MNTATVVVGLIVIALMALAVAHIIKDRRAGTLSCGMNCPGCSASHKRKMAHKKGAITNPEAIRILNEEIAKSKGADK